MLHELGNYATKILFRGIFGNPRIDSDCFFFPWWEELVIPKKMKFLSSPILRVPRHFIGALHPSHHSAPLGDEAA